MFRGRDHHGSLVVRASTSRVGGHDSIPGCNRPKSLKLVVVDFPLGAQDYGNGTTTGPLVSG